MTFLDWAIVLVLNGGVIAYGFYLARGTRTSGEWFLAARALPWWAVGLSMFATNVDNADLVSITGMASKEGLHLLTVHTLGTVAGGILAAFFLVPAMIRAGLYTNAEYLEARFGTATRVVSALIQIQYRTCMLGLMIWSIYLLLTGLVGLSDAGAWALVVALVILVALYTAWGGLKSVVLTDAVQGIIMMAGSLAVFAAVWSAVGGWSNMVATLEGLEGVLPEIGRPAGDLVHIGRYRGADGATSPYLIAFGWVLIGCGYWTVNHTQTMRLMGSRSVWDVRMAALFGTALSIPVMLACISIGIFGRALHPQFAPADQMYPTLASEVLGPGLKGLVVAAMLAAAVSTFDSMGSALSAVFTRDVYARLLVRNRDDRHYVLVGRWATIAILVTGFLYLPFIQGKSTMLEAFLTLVPVLVTPLFTVYLAGVFTRAHRAAGLVGLVVGGLYGILALCDREILDPPIAPWLTGRWVALGWSMLATGAAMAATTLFLGTAEREAKPVAPTGGWLDRTREELVPPPDHPFRTGIPRALRPGWIAIALLLLTTILIFGVLW